MITTATGSILTRITNPQCGLKPGLPGSCSLLLLKSAEFQQLMRLIFLVIRSYKNLQVYGFWGSSSIPTGGRHGFCHCKVYTERGIIY